MDQKLKEAYDSVYCGWWPLLDKYLPQIWAIDPDCEVIVKEKLGTLRIRPYNLKEGLSWKDFYVITSGAERESSTVCEFCGEPGCLRTDQSWWQTLCDRCASLDENERTRATKINSVIKLGQMEGEQ